MRILAVVVAYHSSDLLERCLESLVHDPDLHEVVVVDNASEEGVLSIGRAFREKGYPVTVVDPGRNLGFAAGCNRGAADAQPGWTHVFFINPDVTLTRNLRGLASVLDDEKPTIVSALLRSPEHPASINARPRVTPAREFLKALRGSRAYALKGRGAPGELMKVDQVDGALLGLTAADFSALDGFDPRFELYYEDVDLCARANERNGCVLVLTEWGTHIGGASFATSTRAFTMNRISRIRYLRKHMRGRLGAASVGLLVACTEWAARTLTRQSEGRASRARALRLQLRELASPGSVRLLDD